MKSNQGRLIKDYIQLSKLTIMLPVSLTGFTGYFLFDPHFHPDIFLVSLGILLLAIASSALNQIQEASTDALMNRTSDRPIPQGRITRREASLFTVVTFIAGTVLVATTGNPRAAAIGVFTVFWYNGVYTYSKKLTAFAVVPGALTGALPPLIGWTAAGGGVFDKPIVFIEFMFFMGQVPHFWLLILKYGKEYTKAGIPSLTEIFTEIQIRRLTFVWLTASLVSALFLCYFEVIRSFLFIVILLLVSVIFIIRFSFLLRHETSAKSIGIYSLLLNFYYLLVLILLVADRLIR